MTKIFNAIVFSVIMLIVPATSQAMVSAIPAEALCKAFAQKAQCERHCERNAVFTRSEEREAKQLAGRFGSKIILRSYPYTRYGSAQVNDIEAMLCLRRILRRSEEREAKLLAGRFGSKIIFSQEEKKT